MNIINRFIKMLVCAITFLLSIVSCGPDQNVKDIRFSNKLKIVNWNVQTFFDYQTDGSEYSEFVTSATWGKEMYVVRLERLCKSIKELDADIIVMEEIENQQVIHDISNFLQGEWDPKKTYPYACFAKDEDCSIGCGILSRVPLQNMTIHSLDIRSEDSSMPRMRPIIQVDAICGTSSVTLLVNHWKSKSGGEEITEVWRNREEGVLFKCLKGLSKTNRCVVALGDFNRDINDFCLVGNTGNVMIRNWAKGNLSDYEGIEMKSPWFFEDGSFVEPGSYFFNGEWSRIDNIFCMGKTHILNFYPETEGPWCNATTSIPIKYSLFNGTGYSDHLPILCTIGF